LIRVWMASDMPKVTCNFFVHKVRESGFAYIPRWLDVVAFLGLR